jgi:hypothetical protein
MARSPEPSVSRPVENPAVNEETIRALAGQVSKHMRRRYSSIHIDAKVAVIGALEHDAHDVRNGLSPDTEARLESLETITDRHKMGYDSPKCDLNWWEEGFNCLVRPLSSDG